MRVQKLRDCSSTECRSSGMYVDNRSHSYSEAPHVNAEGCDFKRNGQFGENVIGAGAVLRGCGSTGNSKGGYIVGQ